MSRTIRLTCGSLLALALAAMPWLPSVQASDHDESPAVKASAPLDITDVYVFDKSGKTVIIVAWAGFTDDMKYAQPTKTGVFDPEVLYTVHIDNNKDNVADHKIQFRFSSNKVDGKTGVEWIGVPGANGIVVHATETVFIDSGSGAKLWTGHADDPFFFDALGYLTTLDSAGKTPELPNLKFDSKKDFLAGLNVTAGAIEIDHKKLGAGAIQVWATASKKP